MSNLVMRKRMPDRRKSWTQHVTIDGQGFFLTIGLYDDGSPGEIFIECAKCGTFLRGVMNDLARTTSIMLQCDAGIETAIYTLRGQNYPPSGEVVGSDNVKYCESVPDWIAQELEAEFVNKKFLCNEAYEEIVAPPPEKVAGFISKSVWG